MSTSWTCSAVLPNFIRTLADMAAQWQEPADVEGWVQRCRDLLEKLFAPDTDDQYAKQQFEQSLAKWQEEAQLAEFDGLLPCKTVIRHIRRFFGQRKPSRIF